VGIEDEISRCRADCLRADRVVPASTAAAGERLARPDVIAQFRDAFNADASRPRLLVIVSPT